MQTPDLTIDHRHEDTGHAARLVSKTSRISRGGRHHTVQVWRWSCDGCADPMTGAQPFLFADVPLMELNHQIIAAAWLERYGEPLPRIRRGRPTDAPRTIRVPLRLTEAEAARLDELRGEVSRSEWLRRGLQAAG